MKKVSIYGAGMSGMIAAVNLARDGHEVEVFDREKAAAEFHRITRRFGAAYYFKTRSSTASAPTSTRWRR